MRLTVAEAQALRGDEWFSGVEAGGPWWAVVDPDVREVVAIFDNAAEARERLRYHAEAGCSSCVLKKESTLTDVLGWHAPFTDDAWDRREEALDRSEFERSQGWPV